MKPILFNSDMVRAILDGKKTQTRRLCKIRINGNVEVPFSRCHRVEYPAVNCEGICANFSDEDGFFRGAAKPDFQVGDILYVREKWRVLRAWSGSNGSGCEIEYAAGGKITLDSVIGLPSRSTTNWKPSIHMPKEAARIFLLVTDVRAERLQDLTVGDLMQEGFCSEPMVTIFPDHAFQQASLEFGRFKTLWDGLIPKKDLDRFGWGANPWVWVYTFKVDHFC